MIRGPRRSTLFPYTTPFRSGGATDAAGNGNPASTSTDNTVTFDPTPPTVTINQAAGQADPTSTAPITFTAVFSEPVSGFTGSDVVIGGTAGGTTTRSEEHTPELQTRLHLVRRILLEKKTKSPAGGDTQTAGQAGNA